MAVYDHTIELPKKSNSAQKGHKALVTEWN